MSTKSMPAMKEERYKEAIIEQAKKDFKRGKTMGPGFMELKKSFVSVVSPNRNGSIAQAMQRLPFMQRNKINYMQVKDGLGKEIASFSPNKGWTSIATSAESARSSEFDSLYINTWNALKAEAKKTSYVSDKNVTNNMFDTSI